MASIQSLGVGSGLLTSELVDDIIAAEREAKDLRIEAEKAELEAQISAFGSIKSVLDGLRSATASISSSENLLLKTASSSNEAVVGATATSVATKAVPLTSPRISLAVDVPMSIPVATRPMVLCGYESPSGGVSSSAPFTCW